MSESQFTISKWADDTFGHAYNNLRSAVRLNEEMAELLKSLSVGDPIDKVANEIADVYIVLCRIATNTRVDIHEVVETKMKINRARKWQIDGTGHGYHVKEEKK